MMQEVTRSTLFKNQSGFFNSCTKKRTIFEIHAKILTLYVATHLKVTMIYITLTSILFSVIGWTQK